jgi:16S rRNA (adenine1518-N6/adenine1519-N6)-dimethyltransferase
MSTNVAALLRAHGIRPKKRLGQNFLVDTAALERIASAAELSPEDVVVEVGAGLGTLTAILARQAGAVLAVEVDEQLADILREEVAVLANVEIIQADILEFPNLPASRVPLSHMGYKVVGNLPYHITSALLRRFLEGKPRPRVIVVTVQREVAERIVASPGEMSLLAVSVQFYGQPRIVARIKAGAFYPPPQVDSAVVRIDVYPEAGALLNAEIREQDFFRLVRAGFSQKRKMLRNSLSAGLALSSPHVEEVLECAGIDPRRRPQTLSLEEWARLACSFHTAEDCEQRRG